MNDRVIHNNYLTDCNKFNDLKLISDHHMYSKEISRQWVERVRVDGMGAAIYSQTM